ncbi:MmgE/PrpD family protein [bacterium]|nr:MAG: MmgE/PrpD family protein [bacterium]
MCPLEARGCDRLTDSTLGCRGVTLAQGLARWAAELRFEDLPQVVVGSAGDRIVDTLAIAMAARTTDAARAVGAVVRAWGGRAEATLAGERTPSLPATAAALYNGTCAHALDFDDTHLPSIAHPSSSLVPALLAQGQACGAAGPAIVTALVAGYEIYVRLALAQYDVRERSSIFFEHGLHATSIIGAVAGAAACAKLRGLDADGVMHALAIACSMGSGLIEANRAGGSVKRMHCGWAAHGAIVAAELAANGLTGPPSVLEGRFGFFEAYCRERWRPQAVLEDLGTRWETPRIFYKPYPCNHFTHAIVDAALRLRARGVKAADVERVRIGTATASHRTIGSPIEQKRLPQSAYHAAFSAPFVFATAMVGGGGLGVGFEDFSEAALRDPQRRRLSERSDVVVDAACDAVFPEQFPAVVTVWLHDGQEITERVMANRGGSERPLTRDELLRKAEMTAGAASAHRLVAAAAALQSGGGDAAGLLAAAAV